MDFGSGATSDDVATGDAGARASADLVDEAKGGAGPRTASTKRRGPSSVAAGGGSGLDGVVGGAGTGVLDGRARDRNTLPTADSMLDVNTSVPSILRCRPSNAIRSLLAPGTKKVRVMLN